MTVRVSIIPEGMPMPEEPTQLGSAIVQPNAPMSRVNVGAVRYTNGQDEAQQTTRTTYSVPVNGTPGGSVAASFRGGSRPSVELCPGDPSTRTDVRTAEREGLIRRNAAGYWEDAVGPDGKVAALQRPSEEPADTNKDPGEGFFRADLDADWAADIADLPQHAYDAAMSSMVNVIAHDTGSFADTAKALAANAGIEPALAEQYVQSAHWMFKGVVDRALAAEGLEGARAEEAYAAFRNDPRGLQQALQSLLYSRDVSGFRSMARAFKVASPGDLSGLKAAGFETHVDRVAGDVLVKRPGGAWVRAKDLGK